MKKSIMLVSVLLISISCTKEVDTNPQTHKIIGIWSNMSSMDDPNLNTSLRYVFNLDNTIEVTRIVSKKSTSEVLGFRYRAIGTYEINKDILSMHFSEIYTHDDSSGDYSNINDLELSHSSETRVVTVSFSKFGKVMTFIYPPCPENANCIGSQTFEKSK